MCPLNPDSTYRNKFTTKNKSAWNKGLTKETNESIARCAKTLMKERPSWQLEVDDNNKLYRKFINKGVNAKAEGLICELTFEEYCKLVKEAGLVSSQLGYTGENYVLARYNDKGNYTYSNCRFIKQIDNIHERKLTDKSRESSRLNARKLNSRRYNILSS